MSALGPGEQSSSVRDISRRCKPVRLIYRVGALALAVGLGVAAIPMTGAADAEVIHNSDGTTSTQLSGDFYVNSDGTAGYRVGDWINNSDGTVTRIIVCADQKTIAGLRNQEGAIKLQ